MMATDIWASPLLALAGEGLGPAGTRPRAASQGELDKLSRAQLLPEPLGLRRSPCKEWRWQPHL